MKVYHGFVGYPFDYRVALGFDSIAGGLDHVNPVISYHLNMGLAGNYGGSRHQYSHHGTILSIVTRKQAPGMVKPEIRGNVNFEIKSQFMRELREDIFYEKNKDAHDYVDRVLNIELSTLGTSLKKPLSKCIVHHPRPLNDLKTSTTSSRKTLNRPHLGKECPLNEEVKQLEEDKYGEFRRSAPFNGSNGAKFCVGASVNVMPMNTFEYLRLANLRNTNMLVEMAYMMKKDPLGIIKDLLSRSFYDYKWVFDLEIDQLADEYELEIGKKVHMLDKI
nr:hypothetical protein [Tanacetum cinerariifolium]